MYEIEENHYMLRGYFIFFNAYRSMQPTKAQHLAIAQKEAVAYIIVRTRNRSLREFRGNKTRIQLKIKLKSSKVYPEYK